MEINVSGTLYMEDTLPSQSFVFLTNQDMASSSLDAGSHAMTFGYYSVNDGGNATYVIKTPQDYAKTPDGYLDHALPNGNIAELIIGGMLNVLKCGATRNGTDSTAAVMSATQRANIEGHALYFPHGTYLVNGEIVFSKSGRSIVGDGIESSIIKRTSASFGDSIRIANESPSIHPYVGFTIKDVTLFAAVDVSHGASFHAQNASRVNMSNVFIRNGHKGIWLEGIRDSRFDNVESVMGEYTSVYRDGRHHLHIDNPTDPNKKSTETFFSNFNFTTAGNSNDVKSCAYINGHLDGLWFQNGHWFGGSVAGCIIDGAGVEEISSLTFDHVWFDQFTPRNLVIQGQTTSDKFRFLNFDNCRFWGGTNNNISIDVGSNLNDATFSDCDIGVTMGQGVQIGRGNIMFKGSRIRGLNQSNQLNSYAITTVGGSVNTSLTVDNCILDVQRLKHGINCADTSIPYYLTDNKFRGGGSVMESEIHFTGTSLTGYVSGNKTDRKEADDVGASAVTNKPNIVSDIYNLIGSTVSAQSITPFWHGRRISIKADGSTQHLVRISPTNIRNKNNSYSVTIPPADMAIYEYNADSARWHEL